jgi:hypothetical protein
MIPNPLFCVIAIMASLLVADAHGSYSPKPEQDDLRSRDHSLLARDSRIEPIFNHDAGTDIFSESSGFHVTRRTHVKNTRKIEIESTMYERALSTMAPFRQSRSGDRHRKNEALVSFDIHSLLNTPRAQMSRLMTSHALMFSGAESEYCSWAHVCVNRCVVMLYLKRECLRY